MDCWLVVAVWASCVGGLEDHQISLHATPLEMNSGGVFEF